LPAGASAFMLLGVGAALPFLPAGASAFMLLGVGAALPFLLLGRFLFWEDWNGPPCCDGITISPYASSVAAA
jgi:hypothetical protein